MSENVEKQGENEKYGETPANMSLEKGDEIRCVEQPTPDFSFFIEGEVVCVLENGFLEKTHPRLPDRFIHVHNVTNSRFVKVDEELWE